MPNGYILYNKNAGMPDDHESIHLLEMLYDDALTFIDITKIRDYHRFFYGIEPDDFVIIAGGDGTLHRFVNDTAGIDYPCEILYFPNGTDNRFARRSGHFKGEPPFPITQYLRSLPTVTANEKTYRFLNGVGYGIDGYCCETGNGLKRAAAKPVHYKKIAVRGILFRYVPTDAAVIVDGVPHRYKKVWLASTMHGSGSLSVLVCHSAGRLRTLRAFPSIFKRVHGKDTDMVTVLTGKEITVEFSDPRPLQIDGETILSAASYTAKAPAPRPEHSGPA